MRLGILGGSFDPPHIGHLLVAEDALAALHLDRLIFVPACAQPLKADRNAAPAEHRLAMVRAMVGDDSRFDVSPVEVERGGLSFTVDTLRHFSSHYPSAERFLLLGADVVTTFAQWREPEVVVRLAHPVILQRAGSPASTQDVAGVPLIRIETRRVDISSTEVRARVRQGLPIHGFVTDAVAALIARLGLYR
ncbi:MAG: nicotinate-nucleotide adenylyltransferase [Gemmatimonadota bacterium]